MPFSAPVEKQNCGLSGGWSNRDREAISDSTDAGTGGSEEREDHRISDAFATILYLAESMVGVVVIAVVLNGGEWMI